MRTIGGVSICILHDYDVWRRLVHTKIYTDSPNASLNIAQNKGVAQREMPPNLTSIHTCDDVQFAVVSSTPGKRFLESPPFILLAPFHCCYCSHPSTSLPRRSSS